MALPNNKPFLINNGVVNTMQYKESYQVHLAEDIQLLISKGKSQIYDEILGQKLSHFQVLFSISQIILWFWQFSFK